MTRDRKSLKDSLWMKTSSISEWLQVGFDSPPRNSSKPKHMSHWIRNLPDVGRPMLHVADKLESIRLRIDDIKETLSEMLIEYEECEAIALSMAMENWSDEEIAQAKN